MRRLLTASLASACLALCSAQASADTLQLNSYTYGSDEISVHISGGNTPDFSYSGGAGEFQGTLNGKAFNTYCLDLYQEFNWNTTYTDYAVTALPTQVSHDLGLLVTKYRSSVDSADTTAAFQLAAWEIMYETPGTAYSLNSGAFTENGSSTAAHDLAQQWLGNLGTVSDVNVSLLASPDHQDFLVTAPVPEPSTYAMLVAGLGLLGWAGRRKKHAA